MTAKQALAERARLERERVAATKAGDATRVELRRLEAELEQANTARVAAYEKLARGQKDGQAAVDKAEEQRAALLAALDRARAAYDGAGRARTAVDTELGRLLEAQLPVYAAEAERLTQRADEALKALEEPYREAERAWQEAANAWAPLRPAIHATLESVQDEVGVWRDARLVHEAARVPEFPLAVPGGWGTLPPARPPGVQADGGQVSVAPKGAVSTGAHP